MFLLLKLAFHFVLSLFILLLACFLFIGKARNLINDSVENSAQYLKRAHYGLMCKFLFVLDFLIADWEYGTQVASWDQLISQEMERRLQSFNKNVVGFQWAFYKITERLSKAMKRCGWT